MLNIDKLERDRDDLLEIIDAYTRQEFTNTASFMETFRNVLCHLQRLNEVERELSERVLRMG
ncbi:hypothetical protein BJF93_19030 [Xaviernesmea oryzae]|uniref:Uncharacterized protein n=1 Tax=Xaviernesmea oryzae TaxID=464029 RepID=A0A1Q9B1B6_9HYPH|nr:hypothetical protein [Xaviernesmea oryzae]OLP61793.1 hypothetical protein BJF93_19030 [Xaviernesmea oryzae]SEL77208.1 hypothetical protein SAMN04487976_112134 [Xaviernesmea oryzae]